MKLILAGGFLGSGKTTAIQHACDLLLKEKVKVAVITLTTRAKSWLTVKCTEFFNSC